MHYFFADLTGVAAATFLGLLLVVVPGFGLVRAARARRLIADTGWSATCWALVLAPAMLPAADALLLRWTGMPSVLLLHVALALFGASAAFEAARAVPGRWWSVIVGCFAVVLWANVDFDWAGRLNQPITILDGVKHAAVVASLAAYGAPLHDPFFARPGVAGYYYYFYIAPALLHWVAAPFVSSRAAFAAVSFSTLLAFPPMLMLLADTAALVPQGTRRRFFRIVILLCLASGLDLLAQLWIWAETGAILSQLDWWSEEVRWALTSILWVPHHMTAVIAVYTGCLLIVRASRSARTWTWIGAALAFATGFGCSSWVAIAAVPILGAWWLLDRGKADACPAWTLPAAGAAALVFASPQIVDLLSGRVMQGPPLALFVRPVGPMQPPAHTIDQWLARLSMVPLGYLIEFGVFAVGAIVFLLRGRVRESRSTSIGRLLLAGAALALLMSTFVRSAILYNDFGWRALWFAQVPALLWTASVLARVRKGTAPTLGWSALLAFGIAAVVWDVALLRRFHAAFVPGEINEHPAADLDLRRTYEWIDRTVPSGTLVQHDPTDGRTFAFGLYSDRPVAISDGEARLFGADQKAIQARLDLLQPIFARPLSADELGRRAASAGVGGVILTSADPLWRMAGGPPKSWICAYRSPNSCVMLLKDRR